MLTVLYLEALEDSATCKQGNLYPQCFLFGFRLYLKPFLIFLLVVLFFSSLSTILLELALTRVSSIPFFFAGSIMALVFHTMPQNISKLYFADLVGAASATLLLDPLMQRLGAEHVILLTAPLVVGSAMMGALILRGLRTAPADKVSLRGRTKMLAGVVLAVTILLPIAGNASTFGIFEVRPGPDKG